MSRKFVIPVIICLLLLLSMSFVSAADIEKDDVTIGPEDYEREMFLFADKDQKVDVEVTSDIPIDVYIIASDDIDYSTPDFSKAKVKKEGVTSASFSYTIPDDQTYYLYIYNPSSTINATVSYSYTDYLEESVEEAFAFLGMAALLCIVLIVVVIVVIVLIIYFATRRRKQTPPPPPVQQQGYPGYPQQPGYQQPPPPPPQQGYQGYPPPPPPQQPGY
jgi:hypothetical protein